MAPLLTLITSNLLTRSVVPFRSALAVLPVSAYRVLSRRTRCLENMTQRRPFHTHYTKNMELRRAPVAGNEIASSVVSSQRLLTTDTRSDLYILVTKVPGLYKTETDEAQYVSLNMPGVKKEDVETRFEELPAHFDNNRFMIKEMQDNGMLKLTLPKLKTSTLANIMDYFRRQQQRFHDITKVFPFTLFDLPKNVRSMDLKSVSLTVCMKETAERAVVKTWVPGMEKMDSTSEGGCISLNISDLMIHGVESIFEYDVFITEGKVGKWNLDYMQAKFIRNNDLHMKNLMMKKDRQDYRVFVILALEFFQVFLEFSIVYYWIYFILDLLYP